MQSIRHYRIDAGTPCEVCLRGESRWTPHVTGHLKFHVAKTDDGALWVFDMGTYTLRVEPSRVYGSATMTKAPIPAKPPLASGEVELTKEMVNAIRNGDGSFNRSQEAILGIKRPLKEGWLESLVGRRLSSDTYQTLLGLKKPLQKKV